MALRKKHEVLEEPQDYEIERRETPRYNPSRSGTFGGSGGAAP